MKKILEKGIEFGEEVFKEKIPSKLTTDIIHDILFYCVRSLNENISASPLPAEVKDKVLKSIKEKKLIFMHAIKMLNKQN